MKKPYLIAEIGVNFYDTACSEKISLMEAAKKYIDKAKESGVDAVKFQSYKANKIVSKNSPAYWDLSKEPTKTQFGLFEKHDSFNKEDYEELSRYCDKKGIDFMSTPFDFDSADYLENLVDIYKISSSDLSNIPFIKHIAKKGKPIYLSTGAAYLSEIEKAIRTIKNQGNDDICVMHCVLSYPTKNKDANLNMIKSLKRIFKDLKIGYSDHTEPDETMTILTTAYLYGAEIIEKHFTLDKTLKGNDHYHAADPKDFKKAVKNFRLIQKISGIEEKTVLECEKTSRREARRSLVLTRDLSKGEVIKKDDLALKRPGTGIKPENINIILGRTVNEDLKEDTVLKWSMV